MSITSENYLAIDMGAESGRGMVGAFDGERITLTQVHRFPTGPTRLGDTLHWNLPRFVEEASTAIGKASRDHEIASLGVDTWGVDFGLLGKRGELVGLPVHYRDARTQGMVEKVFERIDRSALFARTGIQTMAINTLFQLAALAEQSPKLLAAADRLLFMPDLMHHFLTGQTDSEYTIASTSQMLDARTGDWANDLLTDLGIPTAVLPRVQLPGSACGNLLPHIAESLGVPRLPVIAPGGHDTACAVAAVPAADSKGWAYLSSGTWSLLGVERTIPTLTPAAEAANVTNEGGVAGTVRLLKNISGLWLVQECRRSFARQGTEYTYDELARLAEAAAPLAAVFDTDDPIITSATDMPSAIRQCCAARGSAASLDSVGAIVRSCLDSLGLKYRTVLDTLESLTGTPIHTVHIVGGGSQNQLLNQITADATGRRVLAGPVEATAAGNCVLQAMARGRIASLAELRQVVRASFPIQEYEPSPAMHERWNEAAMAGSAPE